jgi:hypothetical protein
VRVTEPEPVVTDTLTTEPEAVELALTETLEFEFTETLELEEAELVTEEPCFPGAPSAPVAETVTFEVDVEVVTTAGSWSTASWSGAGAAGLGFPACAGDPPAEPPWFAPGTHAAALNASRMQSTVARIEPTIASPGACAVVDRGRP